MVLDYIITNLDKIIYTLTLILLLVVIISYKIKRISIYAKISWLGLAFFFLTLSFAPIFQFINLFPENWGYYSYENFITYNEFLSVLISASLSFSILHSIHFYFERQIVRFTFLIFPISKFYMVKKELKRLSMKYDSFQLKDIIKLSKNTLYQYQVLRSIKNTNECRIKVLVVVENLINDTLNSGLFPGSYSFVFGNELKKIQRSIVEEINDLT